MEKEVRKFNYSAIVWFLSALSLYIYCTMGFLNAKIPGVEELVKFLSAADANHIYLAGFLSVFIEGLYFIGSFFPGTTLIIVVSILSQITGYAVFAGTMFTIFIGWCLAGLVNIIVAKTYHLKVAKLEENKEFEVKDRLWTTWFPAFRANYEVAQITDGGNVLKVFLSSMRVKFLATLAVGIGALIVPFFIDIHSLNNEEGFTSAAVVATISLIVGIYKIKKRD
ncbi:MAG: hypothetical protein WC087_01675 [Candidatus Paceibacterota bacterium]